MKLKFDRLVIWSLLVILSLDSCGKPNGGLKTSTPNLQTTNPSASPNSDRFLFMRKGKFGYIDRTGQIVIPAKFDRGLAIVLIPTKCKEAGNKDCDRLAYIDKIGKLVFEF